MEPGAQKVRHVQSKPLKARSAKSSTCTKKFKRKRPTQQKSQERKSSTCTNLGQPTIHLTPHLLRNLTLVRGQIYLEKPSQTDESQERKSSTCTLKRPTYNTFVKESLVSEGSDLLGKGKKTLTKPGAQKFDMYNLRHLQKQPSTKR